jgi:hypothetical protein
MDRWVVGRDEAEAAAAAEQRFPGRPFKLQQVWRPRPPHPASPPTPPHPPISAQTCRRRAVHS